MLSPNSKSSFVRTVDGDLYAFGMNDFEQLGVAVETMGVPAKVQWEGTVAKIVSTLQVSVLLEDSGKLAIAGNHAVGEKDKFSRIPEEAGEIPQFTDISAGRTHFTALDINGYCWQYLNEKFKKLENLPPARRIACGFDFTIIETLEDSELWEWTVKTEDYHMEYEDDDEQFIPRKILNRSTEIAGCPFVALARNRNYTAFIDSENNLWLKSREFDPENPFTKITEIPKVVDVVMGSSCVVALDENGEVWMLGIIMEYTPQAFSPRLRNSAYSLTKMPAFGAENIAIAAGHQYYMVTDSNNRLFVLGKNRHGQLGIHGTFSRTDKLIQFVGVEVKVNITSPIKHPLSSVPPKRPHLMHQAAKSARNIR